VTLGDLQQALQQLPQEAVSQWRDQDALQEEAALEASQQLWRYLVETYSDFEEAFEAFEPGPDGLDLEEWQEKNEMFELDAEAWVLIFGRMVKWQHPRWDKKLSTAPKATLESFASCLSSAAPVEGLHALRARCREHGTMAKAWAAITESDEVGLIKWQQSLLPMGISRFDSLQLFRLIQASPFHLALPPTGRGDDLAGGLPGCHEDGGCQQHHSGATATDPRGLPCVRCL
ncbi:unnamed protein product, partial [Effrenium voratum]